MKRHCSNCSTDGHNYRTCPVRDGGCGGGVRIFGVRLSDDNIIKKSASMGNLSQYHSLSSPTSSHNHNSPTTLDSLPDSSLVCDGYKSDGNAHAANSFKLRKEGKKGIPWSEEEHRKFLMGLEELGKGDWRGISHKFVVSRTPTQVASHAQKHFVRQTNASRRKRRSSLFDMLPPDMIPDPDPVSDKPSSETTFNAPSLELSLRRDYEPSDAVPQEMGPTWVGAVPSYIAMVPVWVKQQGDDEVAGLTQLCLGDAHIKPVQLLATPFGCGS